MTNIIPAEIVGNKIFLIREQKVMLDMHLAELYGVPTKTLNRTVKRNMKRFPEDFMFRLNEEEVKSLRYQIGTSKIGRGGQRYIPYAFTEQGVAMLSSILRSDRAVQVNILIMRTFVKIRELMGTHIDLARKIETLENQYGAHDKDIVVIFAAIKRLLRTTQEEPEDEVEKEPMGFRMPKKS